MSCGRFIVSATVYVPLDNERLIARMRPVLSQQELEALLVGADDAPLAWIDDPTERKDRFSGCSPTAAVPTF